MRPLLLPLAALLCLTGCTTTTMNGIMESWKGASLSDVTAQWGYPDSQQPFNGNTLYYWDETMSAPLPGTATTTVSGSTATTTMVGGGVIHGSCVRVLEVDKDQRVVGSSWKGNNCPFAEALRYSTWRRKGP